MPLVIICGYPSSGKTTLALQLKSFLEAKLVDQSSVNFKNVQVVNEEYLKLSSNDYYMNVNEEKKVRAALLAASERFVTKDTVLILDSLNYIKGFRYQLYCQARATATPHLVIHCQVREDTCRQWNEAKGERAYPVDQLEDLILRFEVPNNQNKWDSPLYGIVTEGASSQELSNLFDSILNVLNSTPNRPPSTSTLTTKPINPNSVQVLDHDTQAIVDIVLRHQQDQLPLVKFPGTSKTLALPRPVTVATLSRVRRQFLHLNRLHPITEPEKIKSLFIDFLASNMYL